jgi:hypothetical protein
MKKTQKKAAKALSAKMLALVGTAATIGYSVQGAFAGAVALCRQIGQGHKLALTDAGLQFKAGYIVRYLEDVPAYLKRVGNMDQAQRFDDALTIYGKPGPETAKPNRRTELEHRACRAADKSWRMAQVRAFNIQPKARKPRPAANAPSKAVPVDLVKAAPNLPTKAAVNDYFATALAALLTTVNKNAKRVSPQISSAVTDCHAALKAAGIIQ